MGRRTCYICKKKSNLNLNEKNKGTLAEFLDNFWDEHHKYICKKCRTIVIINYMKKLK